MGTLASAHSAPPQPSASADEDRFLLNQTTWSAGPSASMAQLRAQLRRVAPYFRTAIITGERACGAAILAEVLHQMCPIKERSFVEITSSAAELRFSSYDSAASLGYGMVYLPRPEQLSRSTQVTLLKLLRELGPQAPRIVAFAERGLRSMVSSGSFSADLAEALTALRIAVPPLRDRAEDIPALLAHMLQVLAQQRPGPCPSISGDLLEAAAKFSWPGNFAQLHAVVSRLVGINKDTLNADDLRSALGTVSAAPERERRELRVVRLDDVILEHTRAVLAACNGNKLRAAEALGISRSTLYRMLDAQTATGSLHSVSHKLQSWDRSAAV